MVRQMILINKMSHASPSIRLTAKLIKHAKMPLYKRVFHGGRAMYDYSKQTKTNLLAFYFYNIIQIPVFIVMVLSIRKISTENEDLSDSGYLWFKNLNEPDAYLILPLLATALNYFNLGVSLLKTLLKGVKLFGIFTIFKCQNLLGNLKQTSCSLTSISPKSLFV